MYLAHITFGMWPCAQVLSAPDRLYRLDKKAFTIPLLVPSLSYTFEVRRGGSGTLSLVAACWAVRGSARCGGTSVFVF